MKKIKLLILLLPIILTSSVPINSNMSFEEKFNPRSQKTTNCIGTIASNSAWVYLRPGNIDAWEIYKLNEKDKVVVKYEENGYYFIVWKFYKEHDPIVGWVMKEEIILNKDIDYWEG